MAAMTAAAIVMMGSAAACDPYSPAFTVTTTVDAHDANPTDGVCEATPGLGDCTLRAAIEEGNDAGRASITVPAGTYLITLFGSDPDVPVLDITGKLQVNDGSPNLGVRIGDEIPNSGSSPQPRVIVHDGAMLSFDGGTIHRVRVGGLFVANHATILAFADPTAGALDVLPTGHALISNSNVEALGGAAAVDGITNAGDLTLIHATVRTFFGVGGSTAVTTSGAGSTDARSSRFERIVSFRGVAGVTAGVCSGTALVSQGYNYAGSSCGLTGSTDIIDASFGADPGTLEPSATSPVVDAIPVGVNGCGTDVVNDVALNVRPLDGNGDGVFACDIGASERVG